MKKNVLLLAAVLAFGMTACAPKAEEETEPSVSVEETDLEETEETEEAEEEALPEEEAGPLSTDDTLNEIHAAVMEAYGDNYIPSMPFDPDMFAQVFGVEPDWYETYIAEGPMMSAHVETFVGVKANEENVADVEAALTEYRRVLVEESMQYPMNMPTLEASEVVVHDNYVFFIMLGHADEDAEAADDEAALESAKKNNQKGIDAVNSFFGA